MEKNLLFKKMEIAFITFDKTIFYIIKFVVVSCSCRRLSVVLSGRRSPVIVVGSNRESSVVLGSCWYGGRLHSAVVSNLNNNVAVVLRAIPVKSKKMYEFFEIMKRLSKSQPLKVAPTFSVMTWCN